MLSACVQRFPKTPVPIDLSFHIFHQTHNDDSKIIQEPEQENSMSRFSSRLCRGPCHTLYRWQDSNEISCVCIGNDRCFIEAF